MKGEGVNPFVIGGAFVEHCVKQEIFSCHHK